MLEPPAVGTPGLTVEELTSEQREIGRLARSFFEREVLPKAELIEAKTPGVLKPLMRHAGELGLLNAGISTEHGGHALDTTSVLLIVQAMAALGSFAVTFGAHTGIGMLPLVRFGNREQQTRYLTKLVSGEWVAAYALSEPGVGSDALSVKTTARPSADRRHYVLSGTKQWISNAGFADLFTVFAKVDGSRFTALLVERTMPGVSIGREEEKLGVRGSSTCSVTFDEVLVPIENVLGGIGRGHKVAFTTLNFGRLKLAAGALAAAKDAIGHGIRYAKSRVQFGASIASFGLVQRKLAAMAALVFAGEAMLFRTSGEIDAASRGEGDDAAPRADRALMALEDLTLEASTLKVFASEALMSIAENVLQIHGANGYTEDYPIERIVRDARVNSIFEGTNDINRLIIPTALLKEARRGRLAWTDHVARVRLDLARADPEAALHDSSSRNDVGIMLAAAKDATVHLFDRAAERFGESLHHEQRLLALFADCIVDCQAMDAAIFRAARAQRTLGADAPVHDALATLFTAETMPVLFVRLRRAAALLGRSRDEQRSLVHDVACFERRVVDELDALVAAAASRVAGKRLDMSALDGAICDALLAEGGYGFSW